MCQSCVDSGVMTVAEHDQIQANIRDGNYHTALLIALGPILKGRSDEDHYAELTELIGEVRDMAKSYDGFTAEQATAAMFTELGADMGKASAVWFVAALMVKLHRTGSL